MWWRNLYLRIIFVPGFAPLLGRSCTIYVIDKLVKSQFPMSNVTICGCCTKLHTIQLHLYRQVLIHTVCQKYAKSSTSITVAELGWGARRPCTPPACKKDIKKMAAGRGDLYISCCLILPKFLDPPLHKKNY